VLISVVAAATHVQLNELGRGDRDSSMFNGDFAEAWGRVGGPNNALASSPADEYRKNFGSWHEGICQVVLADASVHGLSVELNPHVLQRLCVRNDGKPVGEF
jgi:hypothetical protein